MTLKVGDKVTVDVVAQPWRLDYSNKGEVLEVERIEADGKGVWLYSKQKDLLQHIMMYKCTPYINKNLIGGKLL